MRASNLVEIHCLDEGRSEAQFALPASRLLERSLVDWMGAADEIGRKAIQFVLSSRRRSDVTLGELIDALVQKDPSLGTFTGVYALSSIASPVARVAAATGDARALGLIELVVHESVKAMITELSHESPGIRLSAIAALGRLAGLHPSAAQALRLRRDFEQEPRCRDLLGWQLSELARDVSAPV